METKYPTNKESLSLRTFFGSKETTPTNPMTLGTMAAYLLIWSRGKLFSFYQCDEITKIKNNSNITLFFVNSFIPFYLFYLFILILLIYIKIKCCFRTAAISQQSARILSPEYLHYQLFTTIFKHFQSKQYPKNKLKGHWSKSSRFKNNFLWVLYQEFSCLFYLEFSSHISEWLLSCYHFLIWSYFSYLSSSYFDICHGLSLGFKDIVANHKKNKL